MINFLQPIFLKALFPTSSPFRIDWRYPIALSLLIMRFKEDLISDFINFKLNNPQALQEEMRLLEDRKECIAKLEEYSKQMDTLRNEHDMYKEIQQALIAKRTYIQENFDEQKAELDQSILKCKEDIERHQREMRERQTANQTARMRFEVFKKELIVRHDELQKHFGEEMTGLIEEIKNLKQQFEDKSVHKDKLDQQIKKLRDRETIIKNTLENMQLVKQKWQNRQRELNNVKQQYIRREKEINELIINSISMEKVIYGNFYKRCSQVVGEMKEGLHKLFEVDYGSLLNMNWEERIEKLLQQLRSNRQYLCNFITQKRERYRVGGPLPEPDAEVYNNIVETKINSSLLTTINEADYIPNTDMLTQIQQGQDMMMQKLEAELVELEKKDRAKDRQIDDMENKVRDFQDQIETKRKSLLSPSKKNKKN